MNSSNMFLCYLFKAFRSLIQTMQVQKNCLRSQASSNVLPKLGLGQSSSNSPKTISPDIGNKKSCTNSEHASSTQEYCGTRTFIAVIAHPQGHGHYFLVHWCKSRTIKENKNVAILLPLLVLKTRLGFWFLSECLKKSQNRTCLLTSF